MSALSHYATVRSVTDGGRDGPGVHLRFLTILPGRPHKSGDLGCCPAARNLSAVERCVEAESSVRAGAPGVVDIPHADEITTWPLAFNHGGDAWYMMSSLGRDRAALMRVDQRLGRPTVLAEHHKVDLGVIRIWNPVTYEIDAVDANHVRQEWISLNPEIEGDLQFLQAALPGDEYMVDSQSEDNSRWIVTAYGPERPLTYFLYERSRQRLTELFNARPELAGYRLAPMQGHVIKARDGHDLVSYLTLPADVPAPRPREPLPMVLIVHGGPWGRDYYAYRGDHQWLANRGYAVLSVNYRASTGFRQGLRQCRYSRACRQDARRPDRCG